MSLSADTGERELGELAGLFTTLSEIKDLTRDAIAYG